MTSYIHDDDNVQPVPNRTTKQGYVTLTCWRRGSLTYWANLANKQPSIITHSIITFQSLRIPSSHSSHNLELCKGAGNSVHTSRMLTTATKTRLAISLTLRKLPPLVNTEPYGKATEDLSFSSGKKLKLFFFSSRAATRVGWVKHWP